MKVETIERLVRRLEHSDIAEITLADATGSVTLRFDKRNATRSVAPPRAAPGPAVLRARAIGRLRLRYPDAADEPPPFPRVVEAGDVVAFLEAGPLLRAILAEADATLGPPLLAEGDLVGYGTPVFPLL